MPRREQPAAQFFQDARDGRSCRSDWFDGQLSMPNFSAARGAPALIGFDEHLAQECSPLELIEQRKASFRDDQLRCYAARYPDVRSQFCGGRDAIVDRNRCDWSGMQEYYERVGRHSSCKKSGEIRCCTTAHRCAQLGLNLLNLASWRVPYNICRNLEWLVCAATGQLPNQGGAASIRFSLPPAQLQPFGEERPLGVCGGWRPSTAPRDEPSSFGYGNDDIFYLEACVLSFVCSNGAQIFRLAKDRLFHVCSPVSMPLQRCVGSLMM